MSSFAIFKRKIGLKTEEIIDITGYTRCGLYNAFKLLSQGKPTKQFLTCMDSAIEKKIQQETLKHEERIKELKELQEEFKEG